MIQGARVITISNGDGGVGKSTVATLIGKNYALRGYNVLLCDFDSIPDITPAFARLAEGNENVLMQDLTRDPQNKTIQRIFQKPQLGLDGILWKYPLEAMLNSLEGLDRGEESSVSTYQLRQRTLDKYEIDMNNLGDLYVAPNSSSFAEVLDSYMQKTNDNLLLRRSLDIAVKAHVLQGNKPFDIIILDLPGDSGKTVRQALCAADDMIPLFDMRITAVNGIVTVMQDALLPLKADESISDYIANIMPALPNKFDFARKNYLESWIRRFAAPKFAALGMTISTNRIALSRALLEYVPQTALMPFEYDPMDDALLTVHDYWLTLPGVAHYG